MKRRSFGAAAAAVLAGCASANPSVVETARARADSLECARAVLVGRGYAVQPVDDAARTLEGEARRTYPGSGAVREIITASVSPPEQATRELRVTVRALDYRASAHGLPINRQSVTEIPPSRRAVADGLEILSTCGVEARG